MTLEERLASIDDPTDIEAFHEVLMHLEQLQADDEDFMQVLVTRLNGMIISWKRPWYQQSNSITISTKDPKKMKEESFRTDTISKKESDQIHKNWKKLRKLFNLPNTPICLARWRNKNKFRSPTAPEEYARRFAISFLAQGLERNLNQVYKHFLVRYGYYTRGYYSPFEEKIIAICLYHIPKNPVPIISSILGRDPRGIYKRIEQTYEEPTKLKGTKGGKKWTLPRATQVVNLLLKYTGEPLKKLKNKRIDVSVWRKLQDDMEENYMHVQYYWHYSLHVQLFVKRDVKRNKLRRKIFKQLRNYPYSVWSDIRWKEIAKHFRDGFTVIFLYKLCYEVIIKKENYIRTPLEELITFALKTIKTFPSRRLRTLILNDNQELQEFRYSKKDLEA